jgi:hypothetical protein
MGILKCTKLQAQTLLNARSKSDYERKQIKKRVFAEIRKEHGVPAGEKFKLFVESESNPLYCVLRNKHTGEPLDNGIPEKGDFTVKAQSPVTVKSTAAKAPVKVAAKAPTKAPVKVAAKAPVKVAAKAPAKAPVKAPVKVAAKKAAPAADYPKSVRISFNGSRVRLGTAKDAAHEKRLIAAYKRANS